MPRELIQKTFRFPIEFIKEGDRIEKVDKPPDKWPAETTHTEKKQKMGKPITRSELFKYVIKPHAKKAYPDLDEAQAVDKYLRETQDGKVLQRLWKKLPVDLEVPSQMEMAKTKAYAEIKSVAKQLVAKGEFKSLPQAIADVAQKRKDLWLKHLQEQAAG